MTTEKCIYCQREFDPNKGEGDHIIPASLGEFRNDRHFRRICPKCNNEIGKCEQKLIRNGPEGYFRQIINPKSKRLKIRSIGGNNGKHFVDKSDHRALVQPTLENPQQVDQVDHLVIVDVDNKEAQIPLFPGMSDATFRKAITRSGIGEMKHCYIYSRDKSLAEYSDLIKKTWPKSKLELREKAAEGAIKVVHCTSEFIVNTSYFRAIAKIAFHYFLMHSQRGFRGDESHFSAIRKFIIDGGKGNVFFNSKMRMKVELPQSNLPEGGVRTPKQWCHILAASDEGGQAHVYVQLFLGPGYIPKPFYVWLGSWDSSEVTPTNIWGHVYIYDEPQQEGNFAGCVEIIQNTPF